MFVDAVKINPQDAEAAKMVVRMDALFLVDREARKQGLSATERLSARREHALPWTKEIRQTCEALAHLSLPQSAVGKAAKYICGPNWSAAWTTNTWNCPTMWQRTRCDL
jgi:hypothetical protein